ncbi:Spermine oxidase [Aphelenchoides besseyi]|nr:Spermine oxidase [Aphelenchoides besseyi]
MDYKLCRYLKVLIVLLVISQVNAENPTVSSGNHSFRIAIVGGGFAGLAAYERLQETNSFDFDVDIFEASNRVGGRVYPVKFEDGYLQNGAQFINGANNPIYKMAERLGVLTGEEIDDDNFFYSADYHTGDCRIEKEQIEEFGKFVEPIEESFLEVARNPAVWNTTIDVHYNNLYSEFLNRRKRSHEELRNFDSLSRFYRSYYESEWSAPLGKISFYNYAKWSDRSDKLTSFTLDHNGYTALLDELAAKVPSSVLHLNSKISKIDYRGNRTRLQLLDGRWWSTEYDFVIVTIPLGHLKAHATHLFQPTLPQRKLEAIQTLGFGSILKVFLVYDEPFWSKNSTFFVPLYLTGCSSEGYLSSELHTFEPLEWNPNVLATWLSGQGPKLIDTLTDDELADHITQHFRSLMPQATIPSPKRLIRTTWLQNDNFRGTYTYVTPEAAQLRHDPLESMAQPVYYNRRPRLLFAGEATHSRIYQTTIGAYLSGRREVDRLLNYVGKSSSR